MLARPRMIMTCSMMCSRVYIQVHVSLAFAEWICVLSVILLHHTGDCKIIGNRATVYNDFQ
jgi:hypothetical protein